MNVSYWGTKKIVIDETHWLFQFTHAMTLMQFIAKVSYPSWFVVPRRRINSRSDISKSITFRRVTVCTSLNWDTKKKKKKCKIKVRRGSRTVFVGRVCCFSLRRTIRRIMDFFLLLPEVLGRRSKFNPWLVVVSATPGRAASWKNAKCEESDE